MKALYTLIILLIPFVGFGQDKWKQGYISDYNTYEDKIFNFKIKIHNSLFETGDESYYEKIFNDKYKRFTLILEKDGILVRYNRDPIGARFGWMTKIVF